MSGDLGRLVIEASLVAMSARERAPVREVAARLREGDKRLHAEYRLALAWAIHFHLRGTLPHVEDVYVVGSSLEEQARRSSDLDLVILGAEFTERDREVLADLNDAVSRAYRDLVGGVPEGFQLLDLHLVPREPEHHPYRRLLVGSNAATYRLAP